MAPVTKLAFPLLVVCLLLSSCSSQQANYSLKNVPAFAKPSQSLEAAAAAEQTQDLNLRQLNAKTKAYFNKYLVEGMHSEQIAIQLRNLIQSPAFVDFDYSPNKTFTAQQAFDLSHGNCMAYSHLYLTLARHFGLRAKYQLIETDPTLVLRKKKISLTIHVNVIVYLPGGSHFIADTVPNKQHLIKRGKAISDKQADALHYNNLAIDAMYQKDYQTSFNYLAKAFSKNANLSLLWSNVGALYRKNHQHKEAEISYQNALSLDSDAYAALNNLAVLYHQQGDQIRSQYYLNKIKAYRAKNPYHHYNLALLEIHKKNYPLALKFIKKSLRLKDNEPEFYFQQSLIYQKLNEHEKSKNALQLAIANSHDPGRTRELELLVKKHHSNNKPTQESQL